MRSTPSDAAGITATVTSASPLQIQPDGSQTSVPALAPNWYTPTAGDRVLARAVKRQLFIWWAGDL